MPVQDQESLKRVLIRDTDWKDWMDATCNNHDIGSASSRTKMC